MYKLAFHPDVARDLASLSKSIQQRISDKVQWLLEHVEDVHHKPLTAQWKGTYRLRVGDYRIVNGIDREHKQVIVYAVGHRREIHRPG